MLIASIKKKSITLPDYSRVEMKCESLTFKDVVQVVLVIIDPVGVVNVALVVAGPVLGDEDVPLSVLVTDPVQEGPSGSQATVMLCSLNRN